MNTVLEALWLFMFGVPVSILLMGTTWWLYRLFRNIIPIEDIEHAYKLKRLRQEIEKRGIDYDEMMAEYHELVTLFKYKRKGILNRVDNEIEGEFDDESVEKTEAK